MEGTFPLTLKSSPITASNTSSKLRSMSCEHRDRTLVVKMRRAARALRETHTFASQRPLMVARSVSIACAMIYDARATSQSGEAREPTRYAAPGSRRNRRRGGGPGVSGRL